MTSRKVLLLEIGAGPLPDTTPVVQSPTTWFPQPYTSPSLAAPSGFTVFPAVGGVRVYWDADPNAGVVSYQLQRAPDNGGAPGAWVQVYAGIAAYYSSNETARTWWRVCNVVRGVAGPWSAQLSATPTAAATPDDVAAAQSAADGAQAAANAAQQSADAAQDTADGAQTAIDAETAARIAAIANAIATAANDATNKADAARSDALTAAAAAHSAADAANDAAGDALTAADLARTDALAAVAGVQGQVDALGSQVADIIGAVEWDSATTYAQGDLVKTANGLYRALQGGNTNHNPDSSPAWWELIGQYASLGDAVAAALAQSNTNASDIAAQADTLDAVVARLPAGNGAVATDASVTAESAARVNADTENSNAITALQGTVIGKADASALQALAQTVSQQGGTLTTQSQSITSLSNSLNASKSQGNNIWPDGDWLATPAGTVLLNSSGVTATVSDEEGYYGGKCLRIERGATSSATVVYVQSYTGPAASSASNFTPVFPGRRFRTSAAVKLPVGEAVPTNGTVELGYGRTNAAGSTAWVTVASLPLTSLNNTDWTQLTGDFTVAASTTGICGRIRINGVTGLPLNTAYLITKLELWDITEAAAAQAAADASASALTALTGTVTAQGNTITSQGTSITSLQNDVAGKASSAALTALSNTVTSQGSSITAQGSRITTIEQRLPTGNGALATAQSVSDLSSAVTSQGNTLTSQGQSITSIAAAIGSNVQGVNLITDPGFELDQGWGYGTGWSRANAGRGGSYCAKCTNAMGNNVSLVAMLNGASRVYVKQGQVFRIGFWYKFDAAWNGTSTNSKLRLALNGALASAPGIDATGTDIGWTYRSTTYTTPSSGYLELTFSTNQTAGTLWVDDVEVTEITDVAAAQAAANAASSAIAALQSTVTAQGNTITSQGTSITSLQNDVAGKASSAALTALSNTVTSQGSSITAQGSRITTIEQRLPTGNGALATAQSVSDLSSAVTSQGNTLTSQGQSITLLNNSLDGVYNARPNLVANTSGEFGTAGWSSANAGTLVARNDANGPYIASPNQTTAGTHYFYNRIAVNGSGAWSFSADIFVDGSATGTFYIDIILRDSAGTVIQDGADAPVTARSGWVRVTAHANSSVVPATVDVRVVCVGGTYSTLGIRRAKLEYGATATPFSNDATLPAKADASALAALQSTVTSQGNTISSHADSITNLQASVAGKASTSALTALDARVTVAQNGVASYEASYTVSVNANGKVAGVKLASNGTVTNFDVLTDNFRVSGSGTGARTEYGDGCWRVYDANNKLRAEFGLLS